LERAEIISKNLPFSKKADIYFRLKRLIDKNEMGKLFKVMLITNKKTNFNIGF
jgi:cyclopropane-fatty-acyl-phospholipid synthase